MAFSAILVMVQNMARPDAWFCDAIVAKWLAMVPFVAILERTIDAFKSEVIPGTRLLHHGCETFAYMCRFGTQASIVWCCADRVEAVHQGRPVRPFILHQLFAGYHLDMNWRAEITSFAILGR